MATANIFRRASTIAGPLKKLNTSCFASFKYFSSQASAAPDCSGIFTPIATPFKNDESIDFEMLEKNLEKWIATDLTGRF